MKSEIVTTILTELTSSACLVLARKQKLSTVDCGQCMDGWSPGNTCVGSKPGPGSHGLINPWIDHSYVSSEFFAGLASINPKRPWTAINSNLHYDRTWLALLWNMRWALVPRKIIPNVDICKYMPPRIHTSHCGTDQKDWEGRVTKISISLPLDMTLTITRKNMVWAIHTRGTVPGQGRLDVVL